MAGEAGGVAKAIAIEKRGGLWLGGNGPEGDVYHVKLRISSHEISAALRSNPLCGLLAKSRAAIATKCTAACGADENMEH